MIYGNYMIDMKLGDEPWDDPDYKAPVCPECGEEMSTLDNYWWYCYYCDLKGDTIESEPDPDRDYDNVGD